MQDILSAQATPGMVLAKDVLTPEGRVLCGKGTVLTETLIERLQKIELPFITVQGHPVKVEGEKSLVEEVAELEARFRDVGQIPPLVYLKKRLIKRLIDSRSK